MKREKKVVVVSGFFDPVHVGHLRHFQKAKKLGDFLVVILTTDEQCIMKKGYCFMPFEERKELLENLRCVDRVVKNIDKDTLSADTLAGLKPDIFAKGGDRTPDNMPQKEIETCKNLGIKIFYGVGTQDQSSSNLVKRVCQKL